MARILVDVRSSIGTVRRLNGVNLAPPLYARKAGHVLDEPFRALKTPLVRLHDAPLDNPGMRLVDIQHIFGNFRADPADPDNYYFDQTDDYIANCLSLGSQVSYRLGTSIEHSTRCYYAYPPADTRQWIEIADRIIRHYNEGWNHGFNFGIRHWEIWNEPNLARNMWNADFSSYIRFYIEVATELKRRFPSLLFGGPAFTGLGCLADPGTTIEDPSRARSDQERFLAGCRDAGAPLDFFSWHSYTADLATLLRQPAAARRLLDFYGYPDCELHLNEWHYFPADWTRLRSDMVYKTEMMTGDAGLNGIDSAAFAAAALCGWQDTPLTLSQYYTASAGGWGLWDRGTLRPYKTCHAMTAFGEMTEYPERLDARSDHSEILPLAGRNADGQTALLIALFRSAEREVEVEFTEEFQHSFRLRRLDAENNLAPEEVRSENRRIRIVKNPGSALFFLEENRH